MNRLRPRVLLSAVVLLLSGFAAFAQTSPVASAQPVTQVTPSRAQASTANAVDAAPAPAPLAPYVASYAVERGGKPLGEATLKLVQTGEQQWRYDLAIHATRGLLGLAGLDAQQSTVFVVQNQHYRPLSQSTVREAFFFDKKNVGTFDWNTKTARWKGDISEHRRQPIALLPGDLSLLLVNLAVIRDAQPGVILSYRVADNGRARDYRYAVALEKESITVNDIGYRVLRVTENDKDTVFWIADGVPTPIRILKRDDGKELYDLTLIEYR